MVFREPVSQRLDRFLEAMLRKGGDRLVLLTGRPVRLMIGTEERVLLDKPVRTDQIDKLVIPVLSDEDADRFCGDGEGEFIYVSPYGEMRIRSKRHGPKIVVEISPRGEADLDAVAEAVRAAEADVRELASSSSPPEPVPEPAHAEPERSDPPRKVPRAMTRSFRSLGASQRTPEIERILVQLAREGGSDLHLTTGQRPKMRKDGRIVDMPGWPDAMSSAGVEKWMLEVASERVKEQFLETHDADYAYEVENVSRYRMNLFRDRNGTGAVIRTIPSKILTFDQLGLPPVLRQFCDLPKGMVLVTGPTGSGKSTTLAAMIDAINKSRSDHIITIEDPVEFVHQSQRCLINQREVHTHTESFSRALRAALREDPDIVLVGEMRDLETVHIAIETAETGHLVFGTLHTNTAASTVDRIIDQFPTDRQAQIRVMLSETLKGVVAQTLCRKVGGGRVACLEILVVTAAISNLIREGKTFQIASLMQTGKGIGMQTNTDAMMALVRDGRVSPLEAFTKAVDQGVMKAALERGGFRIEAE